MVSNGSAAVVVIGGGIVGVAIGYELARRGCRDVLLLERTAIASGATGPCPGGIRQQWGTDVNCRLARRSARFYARINDELLPEHPVSIRACGYLFLAHSPGQLDLLKRNAEVQHRHGIPSRLVAPDEIRVIAPALASDGLIGGSFCAEDAYADDAHHVAVAFAGAARRLGARIVFDEALDFRRDGDRVVAVATRSGIIPCAAVVNAAGQDAPALAAKLGISLPIVLAPRRIAFTNRVDARLLEPLVVSLDRRVAVKQLAEGSFLAAYLGPLDTEGSDGAAWEFAERTAAAAVPLLPLLADLDLSRQMVGPYDETPDHQAILGDVAAVPGYIQAVGFSGHGFMLAPAVAEEIADLILDGKRSADLDSLSLDRFSAGRLVPEPGVI